MARAFQTILQPEHQLVGPLTGTSWHFSDISSDISAPCTHERNSFDVNRTNGLLTGNAKRILCDNVTCFGTNRSCSNRSHLQECFKCLQRVQLSTCFPISLSRIHLTASLYLCLCPADCFQSILFEQAGNSHWNKLDFFRKPKVTYLLPGRMKVPHLMSIRPNASSAIMSHALEQINAA